MNLELVDGLVEKYVKHYKDDWYKIDRPRAEKDGTFVISLRDTGVDCLFLGNEKSYANMEWADACYDSERAKKIYLFDNGKMKRYTHDTARKCLKQAKDTCPEGYWDECSRLTMQDFCPTVKQYKEYVKYRNKQIHYGLAFETLAEWTNAQMMPY